MLKRKKVIIIALLSALVLVGSIAGVTLAQTGDENTGSGNTLLARVAEILGIDQQKLEDAFAQAQREMREEALNNRLQDLVDQGKITQEQADQYKTWWQSKPELPIPEPIGPFGHFGRGFTNRLPFQGEPPCPPQSTPE